MSGSAVKAVYRSRRPTRLRILQAHLRTMRPDLRNSVSGACTVITDAERYFEIERIVNLNLNLCVEAPIKVQTDPPEIGHHEL